jgi:hypothetical protein
MKVQMDNHKIIIIPAQQQLKITKNIIKINYMIIII